MLLAREPWPSFSAIEMKSEASSESAMPRISTATTADQA